MADIAVITGASSGLGVKFLEAVVNRYPQMDEYWILARRKGRLDKLAGKLLREEKSFSQRAFSICTYIRKL